jgi:hypothetical protein
MVRDATTANETMTTNTSSSGAPVEDGGDRGTGIPGVGGKLYPAPAGQYMYMSQYEDH